MPRVTYCIIEPGLEEALIPFGLTSHEFYLMHIVEICQHIEFSLVDRYAASYAKAVASPTMTVTEQQMAESLQSLVTKGLLQEIAEETLDAIREILATGGFNESDVLLGMPRIGGVDFTLVGAELYVRAYEALIHPEGPYCSAVLDEESDHPTLVCTSFMGVESMVCHFATDMEGMHITKVDHSEYGGRLLFYWWHLHDCRKIRLTVKRFESGD
jgi:hypothetical protein